MGLTMHVAAAAGAFIGQSLCGLQLWRFQGWVREKVDAKLAALEQAAKPTIGFHIRGGDKGEEDVLRVRVHSECSRSKPQSGCARRVHACLLFAQYSVAGILQCSF